MLKGIHLTLVIGGQPVPRQVAEALTSVQVTHTAGQRSGFQLGFAMSREGLIAKSLLPSGFFDPVTTRVQIVVTMNGTPNVIMDGLIARHEVAPSGEPGQSALTVTGEDLSLAMDLLDLTGLPYPAMPAEARVLFAVGKYAFLGLVPLIIPSVFIDVPVPTDKIPTHAGTDLAYVKSLAAQVGYVFYVEPGPSLGMSTA